MAPPFSSRFQPVLGSDLHLLVGCEDRPLADLAQGLVLDEIGRLEAVLSTYRPDTPLSRWMRGQLDGEPPEEIVTVLGLAQEWYVASDGALNPALAGLKRRWREAERTGNPPGRAECRRLSAAASSLPFSVVRRGGGAAVRRTGDCSSLDLDAFAKGWIVDRAAQAGLVPGIEWLLVNVGGDMRLAGPGSVRVAVEDPRSAVDNAPPLAVLTMPPGGLASSGSARRGFRVGGRWFGHVLDPRTGWPVEATAGVTVLAPDTVTADALATVVGVDGLDHPRTRALLSRHRAAALVVSAAGTVQLSEHWGEHVDVDLPATG